MKQKKWYQSPLLFSVGYIVLVVCDLVCCSDVNFLEYRYITKPIILISLIAFFIGNKEKVTLSVFRLTIWALIFSLAGDILLLFLDRSELFFISGLVMFLFAHVLYIMIFSKKGNKNKASRLFFLLTVVYAGVLFAFLYPGLDQMLIPVIIYMVAILIMANTAHLRQGQVSFGSYVFVFVGALLFMLSDSLLAYDMFCKPIFMGNVWVMATYSMAQLLIVFGILKQKEGVILY